MLDGSSLRVHLAMVVCLTGFVSTGPTQAGKGEKRTLDFAAQMARVGSWREATHRWSSVLANNEEDAHLHNNLAVAAEALGDWDEAALRYAKALEFEPDNFHIQENYRRFAVFRERLRRHQEGADSDAPPPALPLLSTDSKRSGKVFQVTVGLPMPPRLKVSGDESILVISFLDDDTRFLDINREMVRYLRRAFKNRTAHEILEINPPPAVPEQTVEDLLANSEFWKHLYQEYDADLIVSGVLGFDREDVSGYQDVDVVSPTTGQKVRQMRFVEQERFSYMMEIFFIDGPTGKLLHRDRLQRSAVVAGAMNDPITTFFELTDTMAAEVLAIVTTRVRADSRTVFKY
jgi:hypothetical protein